MKPTSATLSPRELAVALGVSESSIKRWVDSGRVPAWRTRGGHRRIELVPVLKFIRDTDRVVRDPSLLGLSSLDERGLQDADSLADLVYEVLEGGNGEELARVLLAALVTRRMEPDELFDGPVRSAMMRIGDLWDGDLDGVFTEHRASGILMRALDRVDALYEPDSQGCVAVGGGIDGDPSSLPTRMVATVLASQGVYPVDLGPNAPAQALLDAVEQVNARIAWVSVGHVHDLEGQRASLDQLARILHDRGIGCIFGGRALAQLALPADTPARIGSDFADLASFARERLAAHPT